MLLGIIADDVTGATDIASVLMRQGCRVVQTLGVPDLTPPSADAIVVATKTRMAPLGEALETVGAALEFLRAAGADQIFFKYCSTFDSTPKGNIGPITDFLMERMGTDFTVVCPSYPALARTMYQGHLFVGDRLLSESSMRHHPLTPMEDADIVRVMGAQTKHSVGLAPLTVVEAGASLLEACFDDLRKAGRGVAVVDAIDDGHIATIAAACSAMPLVTGGAALGGALGGVRRGDRAMAQAPQHQRSGHAVILSGSCSAMTLAQVAQVKDRIPSYQIDPVGLDDAMVARAVEWALSHGADGDIMLYSSAAPEAVAAVQGNLGRDHAAGRIEAAFGAIAQAMAGAGCRRFIVAGGETSGAVSGALGVRMMSFGPEVAPGVPVVHTLVPDGYSLALKSGNFGDVDFFAHALEMV